MSFKDDLHRVAMLVTDTRKRQKTIDILLFHEEKLSTGKGSDDAHHAYAGGLFDHVVLATILAYRMATRLPDFLLFTCKLDDVVIASLFHDFDKISKYDDPNNREFFTPLDIYAMLVDHGLSSNGIRDGILHSHGGFGGYKDEPYGMTAIMLHAADMIASHVIVNEKETRKAIDALFQEIDDTC